MNKEELFKAITDSINKGEITREEVVSKFSVSPLNIGVGKDAKHLQINKILYVLGAVIAITGLIFFINQIWSEMGSVARILITLGSGILFTGLGAYFQKNNTGEVIDQVLYGMGGFLIPGGSMVTLYEFSTGGYHPWYIALTFGIIFLFYVLINSTLKNVVLTLFTIANATAFIYLVTNAMLGESYYSHSDIYAYLTMAIGISYVLMAKYFEVTWNSKLSRVLYFIGSFAFLGSAYSRIFDSTIWRLLYMFVIMGGLLMSVTIKSKGILVSSTLFLIAYVSYITGKYFADSLGWPISLIILGMLFIVFGYLSININKKYISN